MSEKIFQVRKTVSIMKPEDNQPLTTAAKSNLEQDDCTFPHWEAQPIRRKYA